MYLMARDPVLRFSFSSRLLLVLDFYLHHPWTQIYSTVLARFSTCGDVFKSYVEVSLMASSTDADASTDGGIGSLDVRSVSACFLTVKWSLTQPTLPLLVQLSQGD